MAALPSVTVTGTLHNADGSLYDGSIQFRLPVLLRHQDGTSVVPAGFTYTVVGGYVSVDLLYVDAVGWGPTDWAWQVSIRAGSDWRLYTLAPSVADPGATFGDLLVPGYIPTPGNEYSLVNHTHSDLVADTELTTALSGYSLTGHTHSDLVSDAELAIALADVVTDDDLPGILAPYATYTNTDQYYAQKNHTHALADIQAALRAADERNVNIGEYIHKRKQITTIGPITTGVIYFNHFVGLNTRTNLTLQTTTQNVVATGGTHAWVGIANWNGTQYTPGWVSEDLPSRWSATFTEYNTPLYAVNGSGTANLAAPGFQEVAGQQYAYWLLWIGSGTAPNLPCSFYNVLDSLVEPRDCGYLNSYTAPPSGPVVGSTLNQLGRFFQGLLRP